MKYIVQSFAEALIFGFALFTITTTIFPRIKSKLSPKTNIVAAYIIIFGGSIFILYWLFGVLSSINEEEERYSIINRMTGPYWFWYWFYILSILTFSQLYWMNRFRNSRRFKIISSITFLFVLSYEKIVIFITSLHRDFLPSSYTKYGIGFNMIYDWLIDLAIFLLVLFVGVALTKRIE